MEVNSISIIGMSCLLPEAINYNQYWNNLLTNRNCLTAIPQERFITEAFKNQLASNVCNRGGFLSDIFHFDRLFFDISLNEAIQMDPQHRLALQETWHCIEDACIHIKQLQQSTTSVFAAQMGSDYLQSAIDKSLHIDQYTCLGLYESSLANRISHHFKFSGPSMTTNTACAGSLVSVHQARQSLLCGESDYALIITSNIICHPLKYISFSNAGMLSRTGKCHTFEAFADGYVPGEGICAVLLCKSSLAEQRKHHIYGNILQSGINHNGGANTITSPNIEKQAELLNKLYQNVSLDHLDYIELHGTGTSLGDPIEFQALENTVGNKLKNICLLGSVKTSIGHLEASAGLAGLIKVLLMLQHETLVPAFDIQTPNPLINFGDSKFQLSTAKTEWPADIKNSRIAGISCFGFGGVNAHLVISDAKKRKIRTETKSNDKKKSLIPLLISVKTEASIVDTKQSWCSFLLSSDADTSQICLASIHHRTSLDYRFAILNSQNSNELMAQAISNSQFLKNQEQPYLILDDLRFEIQKTNLKNLSALAKSKIQEIENSSFEKIKHEQKQQMSMQIYILDLLVQANIKPRTIICTKNTMYGVLFYLDCICLKSLEDHLNAGSNLTYHLGKLNIPLILGEESIINKKYIENVFRIFNPKYEALKVFLSKSLLLHKHQYTFQGFLNRWQHQLKKFHIDLFDNWHALLLTPTDTINSTQFIIIIALLTCHEKLRKKWGLSYSINDHIINEQLQDIIHLISNNILEEEEVIRVVLSNCQTEFDSILNKLHLKLTKLNGLPFLKLQKNSITCQTHFIKNDYFEQYSDKNVIYIGSNNSAQRNEKWSIITSGDFHNQFIRCLVTQWLYGEDINWSVYFPYQRLEAIALPKYQFNLTEKYWHNN